MVETHTQRPISGRSLPASGVSPIGVWLVVGIMALATGLGAFAVWFQWGQTRRCLEFFGPIAARRIQSAVRVELWTLAAKGDRIRTVERLDVSQAPGLVHLRRGLIEDVNYQWGLSDQDGDHQARPGRGRLASEAWDVAVAFCEPTDPQADSWATATPVPKVTVLAFDLDEGGAVTVVGQPGRVALGRLRPGLRTWVEGTKHRVFSAGKPGF